MNIVISIVFVMATQINDDFKNFYSVFDNTALIRTQNEANMSLVYLINYKKTNPKHDLKMIDAMISDLKFILNSKQDSQDYYFSLISKIFIETYSDAKNLPEEHYMSIDKNIKALEYSLGSDSFYVTMFKMRFLMYKCGTSKKGIHYKEIELMRDNCIKKFGMTSMLTSESYLGCCFVNDKNKDWKELKKNAELALKIKTEIGLEEYNTITPISYLIKSSVMTGQYSEAIKYKNTIKPFALETLNMDVIRPQLRIFSSLTMAYSKLDKNADAIAMQEMAVAAACELFQSDSPQAKDQALILRDLLAKNKEFTSMRNLENRFKLQPLPLQNGEK